MPRKKFPWLLAAFFTLIAAMTVVLWHDQPAAAISATASAIIGTLFGIAVWDLYLIARRKYVSEWEMNIPAWVGGCGRCLIPAAFAFGIPMGHIFWH